MCNVLKFDYSKFFCLRAMLWVNKRTLQKLNIAAIQRVVEDKHIKFQKKATELICCQNVLFNLVP
jgi:hypothetical protein